MLCNKQNRQYFIGTHTDFHDSRLMCGIYDIIALKNFEQLQADEEFKKFAVSVLVPLKICSKKYNITMPKYLRHIILQKSFTHYHFDHIVNNIKRIKVETMMGYFSHYKSSTVFVDDNRNISVNFKDENHNNILYTLDRYNKAHLIVPLPIHKSNRLVVHQELCSPGIIQKASIKEGIKIDSNSSLEYATSTLKVKKDNKKYIIDLPL